MLVDDRHILEQRSHRTVYLDADSNVCGTEPLQDRVTDTLLTMTLRVQRPCSVDVGLQSSAQTACAQYIQRAF